MRKDLETRSNPKRTPVLSTSRTFGQRSPIVDKDIQTFLAVCMSSWDDYTDEEKRSIILSLPPSKQPQKYHLQNYPCSLDLSCSVSMNRDTSRAIDSGSPPREVALPPLSSDFIASDVYVKRAIARFKRDVSNGYYEKTWQEKAKRSHEGRMQGRFDEYLANCADEMFLSDEEVSGERHDNGYGSDEDFVPDMDNGRKRRRATKIESRNLNR